MKPIYTIYQSTLTPNGDREDARDWNVAQPIGTTCFTSRKKALNSLASWNAEFRNRGTNVLFTDIRKDGGYFDFIDGDGETRRWWIAQLVLC